MREEKKKVKGSKYKIMTMKDPLEKQIVLALLYKVGLKGNKFRLATRKCFLMKCIINL